MCLTSSDRNYGGTLIIWDRLFGTYAEEKRDETIAYGEAPYCDIAVPD